LTEAAARQVTRYLGKRGRASGAPGRQDHRLLGLAYKLEYADELAPETSSSKATREGAGRPKSLPYIDGTELDFVPKG